MEKRATVAKKAKPTIHLKGFGGCDQSDATAEKFFTFASAKNDATAQCNLALMMLHNGRYAEAFQWATLSAAQGDTQTDGMAERVLASLYCEEDAEGLTKSYVRALYWTKKAAMAGDKLVFLLVSNIVMKEEVGCYYEGLYWLNQGTLRGHERAGSEKTKLVSHLRSFCSGCLKVSSSFPCKLRGCTRCLAAYYCSKECQKDHWARVHKFMCCDKNGKPHFSVFRDNDFKDM